MKLSVVVGTLNRRQQIQACIESIFAQTRTAVRVYVTDAGSTDGTIEYLKSIASDRIIPIFIGKRLGQARAYNEVFKIVKTPYVCWLSDDNVLVNRGLETAVRILDENPRIGMVGLKVKDTFGPFVNAPYVGGISTIGILNVNQGVLRTPILKAVGWFSEAFRDYGIDPDLTAKVLFTGHAVVYTREVAIHHRRQWGADSSSKVFARQMDKQRAYLEMYQRKYGAFAKGGLGWKAKRLVWRLIQSMLGASMSLDSTRSFLGLIVRDWHNIFSGRYISLLDPFICRRRPYHLLQWCPLRKRPGTLPSDPTETGVSLFSDGGVDIMHAS